MKFAPIALTLSLAAAGLLSSPVESASSSEGLPKLQSARTKLITHYDVISQRMGASSAADLEERVDDNIGAYLSGQTPDNFTPADWVVRLDGVASLDSSIVDQVVSGKLEPIAGSQGLVERFIIARTDHTWQPFALYVPQHVPAHPALVVLLHGNPQTEAEILSGPYFRTLADATQTVVVAPYGRGIYDYAPPADDEVYQVTQAVLAALDIDPHRVYLVGYSMGGFTVFKIGPEHASQWTAVMCIAGSALNSNANAVQTGFARTRMYVVNGARDENIPPKYGELTAQWLAGVGIPTGFYQQPDGNHYLSTLMPALTKAWHEMLGGFISMNARPAASSGMQSPVVMPTTGTTRP